MHPAWWAAALLLLVNDHGLKGAGLLAASVTGKLSDFAGLLMAPVVLAALVAPRSRSAFRLAHLAIAVVFALLKLSPACAALWCALGGALGMTWRVVSDSTDLVALPMLLVSLRLFGQRLQVGGLLQAWQRVLATVGGGVGLVGIVATSRPPPRYPVITPKAVLIAVDDELQELDRGTGKPQRRLDCSLDWSDRPRLVGDMLYIGRSGVQACDLVRGVTAWERELDVDEVAHADAQRVIARSSSEIWALSPRNGATLWHITVPTLRAVAWQGRLSLQGVDGSFKVVSLDDGQPLPQTGELPSVVSDELFGTRSSLAFCQRKRRGKRAQATRAGVRLPRHVLRWKQADRAHESRGASAVEHSLVPLERDSDGGRHTFGHPK